MKRIVMSLLGAMVYQLFRIQQVKPTTGTIESVLRSWPKKHQINTIIDVGASSGIWSRLALHCYPQSQYFLIGANPAHEWALKDFALENSNAQFILAVAGDKQGEQINFSFDLEDPYSGQVSTNSKSPALKARYKH